MAILVTGGAGYIGSHTVRMLRERGRDVVVIDSLEFGHRAAVLEAPLVAGDIADRELVRRVIAEHDVDAIVHFAAYKAAGESMDVPGRYFANNVGGSLALFESARESGVERLVFSSTCAVYGTPEVLPVSEANALHPESPYGESKLLVERMLAWFDECHGLRSASLRYFNAAGASFDAAIGEDFTLALNLVPLAMKAALGRIPELQVFGTDYPTPDGTAIRDYVHVVDLADAHVRALEVLEGGHPSFTVNLGTGTGSSVQEVIDATRRASGADIPVRRVGRRPGDPISVYADNRKAAELLDWKPQYDLDDIVGTAWRWHSSHPDGYEERPAS